MAVGDDESGSAQRTSVERGEPRRSVGLENARARCRQTDRRIDDDNDDVETVFGRLASRYTRSRSSDVDGGVVFRRPALVAATGWTASVATTGRTPGVAESRFAETGVALRRYRQTLFRL